MKRRWWTAALLAAGMGLASWAASAQEPEEKEKGKGEPAPKPEPAAKAGLTGLRLVAGQRTATADGRHNGLGYTSAPVIDVTQPQPDVLIVTMTGVATAAGLPCNESYAEVGFDLSQNFAVVADRPPPRPVRLIVEGQLVGLFRGNREGAGVAEISVPAEATVTAGPAPVATVGFPGRTHTGKDVVLISDRTPPVEVVILPGEFNLAQKFAIRCSHPKKCFHKNVVMAVFGNLGRAPEWLGLLDPARDLPRGQDLGFRVAIRVEPAPAVSIPAAVPAAPPPAVLPQPAVLPALPPGGLPVLPPVPEVK